LIDRTRRFGHFFIFPNYFLAKSAYVIIIQSASFNMNALPLWRNW